MSDALGRWTRSYDAVARLQTEAAPSHPNGQPLTNVFDAAGNRVELRTWFGILTATHDPRSSITGFLDPQGGRTTWVFDALGRAVDRRGPDGSRMTGSFDAVGQPVGLLHTDAGGGTLDLALVAYDGAGNPVVKVTTDGRHTMSYDPTDQLLSEYHPLAGVKTWSFDPAGNRLSQDFTQAGIRTLTNWSYDPADQILLESAGVLVTTYSFDRAGNEEVVQAPADSRTTNVWDSENRLLRTELPSGGINTMAYRFDGLRHRLADSEGEKRMVWDELGSSGYIDLVQEREP